MISKQINPLHLKISGFVVFLLIVTFFGRLFYERSLQSSAYPATDSGRLRLSSNDDGYRESRKTKGVTPSMPAEEVISGIVEGKLKATEAGRIRFEDALKHISKMNQEGKSVDERSKVSSTLIYLLNLQGSPEDAWRLIDPNTGFVRNSNLGTFFMFTREPADGLVAKLSALTDPTDYSTALNNLTSTRPEELTKLLADGKLIVDKADMTSFVNGLIASTNGEKPLLTDKNKAQQVLADVASMVSAGTMTSGQFASIVTQGAIGDGFDQWRALRFVENSTNPEELQRCQSAVIRNMIMVDPREAMAAMLESDVAKGSASVWNDTINSLFDVDTAYAN